MTVSEHPVVDPSPTAAPIHVDARTLEEVMAGLPKTPASPPEVLELKPNTAAEATEGPTAQISPTAYVEMTKPNGEKFLSPKANVEHYESKGYTAGAEQDIPDLVAYWAEKAAGPAEAAPTAPAASPP